MTHRNKDHAHCSCERAEPDMDWFGRMFIPDAYRFSVEVTDTNGNPLLRFGDYGVWKETPGKEISFGWPTCIRVADDICFVGDILHHRILKIKLGYSTQETARIVIPE